MRIGRYEVVRKLATGGMAEVFLAKAVGPLGFEKTLVIKRILPHLVEEVGFVEEEALPSGTGPNWYACHTSWFLARPTGLCSPTFLKGSSGAVLSAGVTSLGAG